MTRVFLINPQSPFNEQPLPSSNYGWIRLGIAYLSSSLKAQGHEARLLDFQHLKEWVDAYTKIKAMAKKMEVE